MRGCQEKEVLQQADELLKKYGLKGSLFTSPGGGAAGDAMEGMSDDELMRSLTTQLTQAGMALPEETAAADSAGGDGSSSSKKQ